MGTSHSFRVAFNQSPADWSRESLLPCSVTELDILAKLLGIPAGSTKQDRVTKLLNAAEVRVLLAPYGEDKDDRTIPAALASAFKAKELHDLCVRIHGWIAPNKFGRAIVLLNWRNKCRHDGQRYLDELKAAPRNKQTRMNL